MSVNNVGPNVGQSSLLTSYLEKQGAIAPVQQGPAPAAIQNPATQNSAGQIPAVSSPVLQNQIPQNAAATAPAVQNPVIQLPSPQPELPKENKDTKKPSFISKAKELFKNPKTRNIIIAGVGAAIIIAGITICALLSRRKPQVSPEVESVFQDLVNVFSDIFKP